MFRDLKSNGFDMVGTWTEDIVYFQNVTTQAFHKWNAYAIIMTWSIDPFVN